MQLDFAEPVVAVAMAAPSGVPKGATSSSYSLTVTPLWPDSPLLKSPSSFASSKTFPEMMQSLHYLGRSMRLLPTKICPLY